jgi:hypothetical protein
MIYNGYWLVAITALAAHLLFSNGSVRRVVERCIVAGLSFAFLPLLLTIATIARGSKPFVRAMFEFAHKVREQGYPPEGWSVPWAFLWHSEHGLLLAWVIGVVTLAWFCLRRSTICQRRGPLWLALTLGGYVILAVGSIGPTKLSIYGRTARELVPFLSLATACAVTCLMSRWRWRRGVAILGVTILAGQALLNFSEPFAQQFPIEFERRVKQEFGPVPLDVTVQGPSLENLSLAEQGRTTNPAAPPNTPNSESVLSNSRYILYSVEYLYPIRGPKPARSGAVLVRAAHPLQFLPYTYEGYTPTERSVLRSTDISMRLVDTGASAQSYSGFQSAILLTTASTSSSDR